MIARVMAAVDRSMRAPAVLARAAEVAAAHHAQLHLLRVVEVPAELPPAAHVAHADDLAAVLRREAERDLTALAAGHVDLVTSAAVVVAAEPWRAILDAAASLSVDLLVIGTHTRHGLERILGTTASRLIKHADRDLLVVHPRPPG